MSKNVRQGHPTIAMIGSIAVVATSASVFALVTFTSAAAGFIVLMISVAFGSFAGPGIAAHIRGGATPVTREEMVSEARRSSAFTGVGRLLPAGVRDEYCEEWATWMADLRADGTPRVRRWLELLSLVLIAVPRAAISQRWATVRRAVDR